MTSEIILTPQVVNEIEFYVSDDGKARGLSIAGLARLCGVDRNNLSKFLDKVDSQIPGRVENSHKVLEKLAGDVFTPGVKGANGAKIVNSKSAARIIRYFAYEAKNVNDTAKNSYDKFAEIGIDSWIAQITGYSESNQLSKLEGLMTQMIGEIQDMKVKTVKYDNIKATTTTFYPGVEYINSSIEDGSHLLESVDFADDDGLFTATEWLKSKGLILEGKMKRQFSLMTGQTYRAITGKEPRTVMRKDKNGNLTQKLNGYNNCEVRILEVVLRKLFGHI
jgi:hypothetical protein